MTELTASSKCPVCGHDKPHGHTFRELSGKVRDTAMRRAFQEKFKHHYGPMADAFQYSFGIALTMFHKDGCDRYVNRGVELMWLAFCAGAEGAFPPLDTRDETPTMAEALAIVRQSTTPPSHPWG